ncbi:MAG TPA: biotin--[acetyl-CoA-carboxylase] ligase [Alphaproteobacteria bacterium]|nr:biotin--[acetyl-CoA-carboxylase] ligase [Alphaproteobacteria bacterium]
MSAPRLPTGWHLEARVTVGSTNEEAKRLALAGAPQFTLVWALEQTKGRGRRGRSWSSPRGNLYLSVVLRPVISPAEAAQIGFVAAVALAETVHPLMPPGVEVALKWPNDVLVGRRKVSGILPEAIVANEGGTVEVLILGIGVNVTSHPVGTTWPATDLARAGVSVTLETLLERLADNLDRWVRLWGREGFAPVRRRWMEFALAPGQPVELRLDGRVLTGRFLEIDAKGALVLDSADGSAPQRIHAGEVFFPGL